MAVATYQCIICGWIYDETKGCPEEGIPPGTRWEDVPDDWSCPVCGASKGDFEMAAMPTDDEPAAAPASTDMTAPLVIVGSGFAAYSLAREYRKIDTVSPMILVTRDSGGYYIKPSLSNALANNLTPDQLETRTAAQMAAELHAEIRTHCEVTQIDAGGRRLRMADGASLDFHRLVLAWGAEPVRLDPEGDGADAVQSVNDLDDFRRFHASLADARSVAVIGNGLIGCEFANDLAHRKIRTSLIGRASWPLDRLLPETAGRHLAASLQAKGVEFFWNTAVKSVWRADDTYRLDLSDGRQIFADRILSAVGLRPRTTLAEQAGISCRRGIATDRFLETNVAGIYAMGDCAEVAGLNLPFIAPITYQAKALAKTLTGTPTAVAYPVMPIVVKTPACPVIACPPPAEAKGTWHDERAEESLEALFLDDNGQLHGFALLGKAVTRAQTLAARLPPTLD